MKDYITIIGILCLIFSITENLPAEDKPTLLKVIPLSQTAIQLQFDSELNAEEAENHLHYQITPDITVEMALLSNKPNRVLLFTSPMEIQKSYSLKLKITDSETDIQLPAENEITFGTGDNVTFSGKVQDTTLIVNKNRKIRNNNVGAVPTLVCEPTGSIFFIAFDLYDAFEDMGIRDPKQVLDVSMSLHSNKNEIGPDHTVILRRVLLPWREGRGTGERAKDNELTFNSPLHRNLPWNKAPAQAMLAGIDGDNESDYNGSEDVAHRIDGEFKIQETGKKHTFKSELMTDAVRFWVANPDYNYGYLFALREGNKPIMFSSKEAPDENRRPILTIRYQTKSDVENVETE
ncbi:hypothetical protein JT359_08705 [Candidatus Poribacteria bacterium]|nr:hypothetical protein [Candidatus Poribacteria bacterium]